MFERYVTAAILVALAIGFATLATIHGPVPSVMGNVGIWLAVIVYGVAAGKMVRTARGMRPVSTFGDFSEDPIL